MKKALKILTCLPVLWASLASATSPCKGDACIDEASASFIAPYDVMEAKCSSVKPGKRAQYSAVVANFLRGEDVDFLIKLRASSVYAKVHAEIESKINGLNPEEIGKACDVFSQEAQDPTDQATRSR